MQKRTPLDVISDAKSGIKDATSCVVFASEFASKKGGKNLKKLTKGSDIKKDANQGGFSNVGRNYNIIRSTSSIRTTSDTSQAISTIAKEKEVSPS